MDERKVREYFNVLNENKISAALAFTGKAAFVLVQS